MRIFRISPKNFGRFTSETPLVLPKEPMVVVYGKNESGKTTYLDMTVALLSSQYDPALMEPYGKREEAKFSGSIGIHENGEDLTIEFGRDAKVPRARSKVPRTPTPKQSVIWNKIENLELDTVRNLFRVSSTDISDGDETLKKFSQYSLGDRGGHSVTGAIERLMARGKAASGVITKLTQDRDGFKENLNDVESTTQEYKDLLAVIAQHTQDIEKRETKISSCADEIALIDSCGLAMASFLKAKQSKEYLNDAERDHTLVPQSFASISEAIQIQEKDLTELELRESEESVDSLRIEIRDKDTSIENDLRTLGIAQDDFERYPKLTNDADRQSHIGEIRTKFAKLELEMQARDRIDTDGPESRYQECSEIAKKATENWEKFNTKKTAQEFLISPNTQEDQPRTVTELKTPARSRILLIAILAVTAIASVLFKQYVGASVLGAIALGIAVERSRNKKSNIAPAIVGDSPSVDMRQVKEFASQTAQAEHDAGQALALAESARGNLRTATEGVRTVATELEDLLKDIGFGDRNWLSVAPFNEAVVHMDRVALNLGLQNGLRGRLKIKEGVLQIQTQRFSAARTAVIALLAEVGLPKSDEQLPTQTSVLELIRGLKDRYGEQEGWRRDILNHDRLLESQRGDPARFQVLLALTSEERDKHRQSAVETKELLEDEIEELQNLIRIAEAKTAALATSHRMNELNLNIGETQEQIREAQLMYARLNLLASKMETLALARAEATKPELHKKVQEMVVAVAEDWKSVDLSGPHPIITYKNAVEVEDTFLSAGGRTLLYTAMRIAIMQQEEQDDNAPSLPLLCDDPLLHLDDVRTVQAFKMMKEQSEGHQIIYFTCKDEIRDLAEEMNIPVITI